MSSSRDTQEISPMAGDEMLRIFHEFNYESSIMDDFEFYEIIQYKIDNNKNKFKAEIMGEDNIIDPIKNHNLEINPNQNMPAIDIEKQFSSLKLNSNHNNSSDSCKNYFN